MTDVAKSDLQVVSVTDNSPLGIFYLCAGLFIFSFQDVIIKELSDTYPVHQLVFIRGLVAAPLLFLLVHFDSGFASLKTKKYGQHALRILLMFCSYLSFYLAIAAIPLTTAVSLYFTAPLMITALAVPILGEKVGIRRLLGIVAGFGGVMVMLRPGAGVFEPAALLPIISAFTYAASQMLSRKLGSADSASMMAFYIAIGFTYIGGVMGLGIHLAGIEPASHPSLNFLLQPWKMPSGLEFAMIAIIGVISAMGFFLLSQAYRIGVASTVAPFEYTAMLWAVILSYLVWGTTPDVFTIVGALIIVASGVYVLRRERVRTSRPLAAKGPYRSR